MSSCNDGYDDDDDFAAAVATTTSTERHFSGGKSSSSTLDLNCFAPVVFEHRGVQNMDVQE